MEVRQKEKKKALGAPRICKVVLESSTHLKDHVLSCLKEVSAFSSFKLD